jgi:hypothetical protein
MKLVGYLLVVTITGVLVAIWSYRKDRAGNPEQPWTKPIGPAVLMGLIAGVTVPLSLIYMIYSSSLEADRKERMQNF